MSSTRDKVNFRYLFKDVVRGFSVVEFEEKELYIKHLSALDQVDLEEREEQFFTKAEKRGLPTEEETVARLKEEGMWTAEDQTKLKEQELYIESLENTRKQLYLKHEIEDNVKQTSKANKEFVKLCMVKEDLIGQTCEKYARTRVSDHYILESFYNDLELKQPTYKEEGIDDLGQSELMGVIQCYNNKILSFTEKNIQGIVLQDFYSPYFPFCDNVMNFYNQPLFDLSVNQVKLIVFTRMFKNIFESYPKMPDSLKKDPDKIIDYVNSQDKAKDVMDTLDKDGASTVMGATKEDYEYLGYKENPSGRSLSDMLKAKGGRMDMNELMETMT
tara:strand:+ start:175 stop:1164 length:990 start_codon:yes stop_codon:yes gene_type:complete